MALKVLIVSHAHPDLSAGGAEIASYRLFKGLGRIADIEACYLARTDDPAYRRPDQPFVNYRGRLDELLFYTDNVDPFLFSQRSSELIRHFAKLLDRLKPEVIHFHHYTEIGLELIAEARKHNPKIKIFLTLHEFLAMCHHFGQMVKVNTFELCDAANADRCTKCFPDISAEQFRSRRQFIQRHFDLVDQLIAPSYFLRQRYIEWGVPDWQIVTIDNGIPPVLPPAPRALRPGDKRGVFGFFGQINPFKGLLHLLTAFRLLDQVLGRAADGIELRIHGAYLEFNPRWYVDAFRKLVDETAGRVQFAGPYQNRDLGRLMGEVDWVVVPSLWWENSPLVIQEAFAHRRPVICGDVGGMAEKVRWGRDGYHFRVGDAVALARLIARVASDTGNWDRLQQTIQRPVTIAETVARHVALYRDASFTFA